MFKKLISALVCLCMVIGSMSFVAFAGDTSVTVWSASSGVESDAQLDSVVDKDADTVLTSKNLGKSTAWRIFIDLAPAGGEVAPYSKVKLSMEKYNAMKVSVYTSDKVYNALGKETTPPAENSTSSVKFKSYTSPVATEMFDPYYVSVTGEEGYPDAISLNFTETSDRFVCVEITTGYDSKTAGTEYYGINNEISEIEISSAIPHSMQIDCESDKVAIPAPGEDSKEITFSAKVYDEDNGEIEKEDFLNFELSLADEYPGISVDGNKIIVNQNAAEGTVIVKAALTAEGYEHITAEKEITVLPADMIPYLVKEAAEKIDFSMISSQRIFSVSRNLSLFYAEDGVLKVGDSKYEGFDITWKSSNAAVISDKGVVTRPASKDVTVTLTATVSAVNSEDKTVTAEKDFVITVKNENEPADMVNIIKGGYGWTTSGWGNPAQMADGDMTTRWTIGNHSNGNINGAVITGSGKPEKYNKVIIYFWENSTNPMSGYSVAGYDTMKSDPGKSVAARVETGTGIIPVITYDETNPATVPDDEGKVVVYLSENAESKYFVVNLANSNSTDNSIGVFELEVYYATPFDARLSDSDFKFYIPMSGKEKAEFDLPKLDIFDETGDLLRVAFDNEFSLARSYTGVELTDGKIVISSDCTEDSIELNYRSWDDEKTLLETTITVPVEPYGHEYYDCENAIAKYMDQIPEICEENLNLPTEENGCSLKWISSDEKILSTDGILTRPVYPENDVTVTLTCVATKDEYRVEKSLEFIVSSVMTDEQRVRTDADKIDLGIEDTVDSDIDLPDTGYYGSKITWSSSNKKAISDSGEYSKIKADSSSVKVTLTAKVSYNGITVTKDFVIYAKTTKEKGSSSGGGGGGGSTVKVNPVILAPENPEPLTQAQLDASVFDDVPSDHWAKEYIEKLYERKIINGMTEKTFEPERTITREEYVKLIVTAFDIVLKPGEVQFKDVVPGAWYEDYVVAAYKAGIINGVDETTFGIGHEITRQDMAVILERALTLKEYEFVGSGAQFGDMADISEYALASVENLSKIEIISGDDKGNFNPQNSGTRAEAAKLLYSAMEKGGIFE